MPRPAIILHLSVEVAEERRAELLQFLSAARQLYERPGDIRVRLLRSLDAPSKFIEVIEYATKEAYEADQRRVAEDEEMIATLGRWRSLLSAKPEVEFFEDITDQLGARG